MASAAITVSCFLAAWMTFDLLRTFKTGRARTRHGAAPRTNQPVRFWTYVYAEIFVLAVSFGIFCLGTFQIAGVFG